MCIHIYIVRQILTRKILLLTKNFFKNKPFLKLEKKVTDTSYCFQLTFNQKKTYKC